MTNHHPNCPHVDDSLIDTWTMSDGYSGVTLDNWDAIRIELESAAENDMKMTVVFARMHKEVFDALPEFQGF